MTKQVKAESPKPSVKRVEVFILKYCDKDGDMHAVGEECEITDAEELAHLTQINALKTIVKEV